MDSIVLKTWKLKNSEKDINIIVTAPETVFEALIPRYLFLMPLFETNDELLQFLTRLVMFIIQEQV